MLPEGLDGPPFASQVLRSGGSNDVTILWKGSNENRNRFRSCRLRFEERDGSPRSPAWPSDYPDFAEAVGKAIMASTVERGILICGSGVGVCVAANKMPGIRAAICHDAYSAHQGVEHDDMNVLVLGSRIIGSALAFDLVQAYLSARFQPFEERFVRRLNKLKSIEHLYMRGSGG